MGEEELKKMVEEALAETSFGPRDMGAAMKVVQAKLGEAGGRADGRMLSEMVKLRLGAGSQ